MAFSWPLWADRAAFPLLPCWGEARLHGFAPSETLQSLLWAVLAGLAIVFPRQKVLYGLTMGLLAFAVASDLNRLQPWVWFYGLVLWIYAPFGVSQDPDVQRNRLKALLAAVYIWGGLYKCNPYFAESNWPWFCDAFAWSRPLGAWPGLGYGVAAAEALLGFGLLWPASRVWSTRGLIALHGTIVVFLLALDWNAVVLPWNICMAVVLFWISDFGFRISEMGWGGLLLLLFPALGLWQGFPHALAWKLYDNTQPEAVFFMKDPRFNSETLEQVWSKNAFDGGDKLALEDWCQAELKVPVFAAEPCFQKVHRYLCRAANTEGPTMKVLKVCPWNKTQETVHTWNCPPKAPTGRNH